MRTIEEIEADCDAAYERLGEAEEEYEAFREELARAERRCEMCAWWSRWRDDDGACCQAPEGPLCGCMTAPGCTCEHWEYDNDEERDTAGVSGTEAGKGE